MKSISTLFHWLPRILGMIAIAFISLFAADSFQPGYTIWQQITAFLIHLIPSFILLVLLLVAWKWEFIGGILFTIIGVCMTPLLFYHNYSVNHFSIAQCIGIVMLITFPFIVVGILFIISHSKKKKHSSQ
jgi:hypothetical protein